MLFDLLDIANNLFLRPPIHLFN